MDQIRAITIYEIPIIRRMNLFPDIIKIIMPKIICTLLNRLRNFSESIDEWEALRLNLFYC